MTTVQRKIVRGGSPGLVVMGGDSCSRGHGFESQHHILDGLFSHFFVIKIEMFVWKDENKQKEARDGPLLKKKDCAEIIE